MSLTSALYTGVSGLLANGESMNVIGNNISNVNTVGFKDGRSIFSDLLSQNVGNKSQLGMGVQMQSVQNVFSQGTSQASANVTDLAIQGNSFFALGAPTTPALTAVASGSEFLSRAGSFNVNNNYELVNPDGYKVLDTAGKPITFVNTNTAGSTTDFGKITKVDPNGIITYLATDGVTQCYYEGSGVPGVAVGGALPAVTLAVVTAKDTTGLTKVGGSLYQATGSAGASGFLKANGTSEQVLSNTLEGSNVDMASEFVNMIVTQRAYSANSKTITTTDQMTQEVLGLIR